MGFRVICISAIIAILGCQHTQKNTEVIQINPSENLPLNTFVIEGLSSDSIQLDSSKFLEAVRKSLGLSLMGDGGFLRYQWLAVFPQQSPLLLVLNVTSKGNGGHQLFRIFKDTLQLVFDGFTNQEFRTYDAHQDNIVYNPSELKLSLSDENDDGFNDLKFTGEVLLLQGKNSKGQWFDHEMIDGKTISYSIDHPYKKFPLELIYYYDSRLDRFSASKNNTTQYKLLN